DWWAGRGAFDLYVSQFVLDEAAAGDAEAAARRMEVLRDTTLLDVTDEATALARELLTGRAMPSKAQVDAFHVAVATVHGMDYLLSWNCAHIANATMRGTIEAICRAAGFVPPVICTPLELTQE
ncbi:MAG: type II toxin-antitoxin system VapC family toxin, partial [Planctomycetota bacterium]